MKQQNTLIDSDRKLLTLASDTFYLQVYEYYEFMSVLNSTGSNM